MGLSYASSSANADEAEYCHGHREESQREPEVDLPNFLIGRLGFVM